MLVLKLEISFIMRCVGYTKYNKSNIGGVSMSNQNQELGDKVKGAVNKAKGEVKDQVGNATNNKNLQASGKKDKAKGKVQEGVGKFKDGQ